MGYSKLFSEILTSTLWAEELHTRVVFVSMLALADQDGVVPARLPGIARAANVPQEQTLQALERLAAPDPHSRSREQEGRRIVETDDGWQIVNYEKYRERLSEEDKAARKAARNKRYYERHIKVNQDAVKTPQDAVRRVKTVKTHSEAEASAKASAKAVAPLQSSNNQSDPKIITPEDKEKDHQLGIAYGAWPAPGPGISRENAGRVREAFYAVVKTPDDWADFQRLIDERLNIYNADRSADRRRLLGSFVQFCEQFGARVKTTTSALGQPTPQTKKSPVWS